MPARVRSCLRTAGGTVNPLRNDCRSGRRPFGRLAVPVNSLSVRPASGSTPDTRSQSPGIVLTDRRWLHCQALANSLPDDLCRFIERHVHTLEQLEILLLLFEDPARSWSASELARELRTNVESVCIRLAPMVTDGLTAMTSPSSPTYCYRPASERLDEQVGALIRFYRERRVAVITQIFAPPTGAARVFADAFRIKKGDG
jgi:hypothetical protein